MTAYSLLIHLCTTIGAIFGAVHVVQKTIKEARKERAAHDEEKDKQAKKILKDAQEAIDLVKTQLEAEIKALNTKVNTLKVSTDKEFLHFRETYNSEIRNLGEKIEQLRDELRTQHGQLVTLLTKMISERD